MEKTKRIRESELTTQEKEVISKMSAALGVKESETTEETDNLRDIVEAVKEKKWDKYQFHNLNITTRSFIKICMKFGLVDRLSEDLQKIIPRQEEFSGFFIPC